MMDYLYDGSFEGLLTCVYLHYYEEEASGIYIQSEYQSSILNPYKEVITDFSHSDKVYTAIHRKVSHQALRNVYYLYLSSYIDKEMLILKYLKKAFKIGNSIDTLHSDPVVHDVHLYARRVSLESHRFLGLVRFSDVHGLLYSEIQPDHDILVLIGNHFADRFKNEKFMIYDKSRNKALISTEGKWHISAIEISKEIEPSEKEQFYRNLWKNYHKHIAIMERKNSRLQLQYMPNRYWKHLTEI